MSDRPTPETDAAVIASDGQWSFILKETCQKLERERDEALEALKHVQEYGTDEINAAVELRQKLAKALVERDEARDIVEKLSNQGLDMMDENKSLKRECDEAREALNKILKNE